MMINWDNLRELLKDKGIKSALAKTTGISTGNISDWLNPLKQAKPSADALYKMSQYFNCSVDYLLGLSDIREIAKQDTQTTIYRFPIYEQQAAAGAGMIGYDKNYEMEDIITDEMPPDAKFAIKIKGESMSPDILDGCIVLINPNVQENTLNRTNVVANFNGEIICKQYNKKSDHIWFASLNRPDYNNDDRHAYSTDEYKIIGKVVKVIK